MSERSAEQQAFFDALTDAWGGSGNFHVLPLTAARRYLRTDGAVGWRTELPSDYLGRDRHLDIVLPGSFPTEGPSVFVEPNPYLMWPHAEPDGKLCLWAPGRMPVWLTPKELAAATVERLRWVFDFVGPNANAELRREEFAREWTSYWRLPKRPRDRANGTLLLLDPLPGDVTKMTTALCSATGRREKLAIAAVNPDALARWLAQSGLVVAAGDAGRALIVRLHTAPDTPGAPAMLAEIGEFIDRWASDAERARSEIECLGTDPMKSLRWLVFQHDQDALAALQLTPRFAGLKQQRFRSPKARRHAEAKQAFTGVAISVMDVQRADPTWLYERGRNSSLGAIQQSHVVFVGCGSLGSQVVESAALLGVGTFTLVDPERLEAANVGRHALGIGEFGQYKAEALRTRLANDYPHFSVTASTTRVEIADEHVADALSTCDLVVCTTADPASERYLMSLAREGTISSLIVAWTEPHALAGHSVHVDGPLAAPERLFEAGRFYRPAIDWPIEQEQALPGCGASHLPGAGNRIRWIATQVAEHVNDVIVGRRGRGEVRTFVEASDAIQDAGASRLRPSMAGPGAIFAEPVPSDRGGVAIRDAARA